MATVVPFDVIVGGAAQISGLSQADVRKAYDGLVGATAQQLSTGENKEIEMPGFVKLEETTQPGGTATPPGMTEPYTYGPYQRVVVRVLSTLRNAVNNKSANNRLIEQEQPQLFMQLMDGEI